MAKKTKSLNLNFNDSIRLYYCVLNNFSHTFEMVNCIDKSGSSYNILMCNIDKLILQKTYNINFLMVVLLDLLDCSK